MGIPHFYYIKVGFEGVYFTRTCFPDVDKLSHQHTQFYESIVILRETGSDFDFLFHFSMKFL